MCSLNANCFSPDRAIQSLQSTLQTESFDAQINCSVPLSSTPWSLLTQLCSPREGGHLWLMCWESCHLSTNP